MTSNRLSRCALLAVIAASSAFAGEFTISPEVKFALGTMSGAAADAMNGRVGFALTGSAGYKLTANSSIIAGLGYRAISGDQYLKEGFTQTSPLPANSTLRLWNRKNEGEGIELNALYRMHFGDWYAQGGARIGRYKVLTHNAGSEITTGPTGAVVGVKTIAYITRTWTTSPGLLVGGGYLMAPNHAIEFNLNTVTLEAEGTGKKHGLVAEFGYCLRF